MTERDPVERRLMLARAASWAPEAAKARVRANLVASSATAGASATTTAGVTKLTTALLVSLGFVAGYLLGVQRSSEPRSSEPAREAASESAESSTSPLAASPPSAIPSAGAAVVPAPDTLPQASPVTTTAPSPASQRPSAMPATRAVTPRAPARRATNDPGAQELALLSRAERAIRAGEPALALTFLDELEKRFPSSALLEERTAARLLAGCALSSPGARRRAELFLRDRTASVYTDRVRRSCRVGSGADSSGLVGDGSSSDGH